MKKIRNLLVLIGIFFTGTAFIGAQAHHESFEDFNCEYDCSAPCYNYFYDGCIPNWFSASNNPGLLKNSCDSGDGVLAEDGDYYAGVHSLGRFIFYELPDGEIFHNGKDYLISYYISIYGFGSMKTFLDGYTDLTNVNGESTDGNFVQSLVSDESLSGIGEWKKYSHCITIGSSDFNQLLFSFDATDGGNQNMPQDPQDCICFHFLDNINIICQQNYDIVEVNKIYEDYNCFKSRTFELIGLGDCDNNLSDYEYTVKLFDNQNNEVKSYLESGNTFTLNFEMTDDDIYTMKIYDLNSPDCGYTIPSKIIDLSTDFAPAEITGNVVWDQTTYIKTPVHIKPGAELTVSAQVMSQWGEIVVEPGAKLTLLPGADLTSLCTDEWEGVIVEGDHTQGQANVNGLNYTDFGFLESLGHNDIPVFIENAHNGVRSNAGIVQCDNTFFMDCGRGVFFDNYDYEQHSFFTNCTFSDNYKGIYIYGADGVEVENTGIFENQYGIFLQNAVLSLGDDNYIEACDYGIYAISSGPSLTSLTIEGNNTISDNDLGMYLSGTGAWVITNITNSTFENNTIHIVPEGENIFHFEDNEMTNSAEMAVYPIYTGRNYNKVLCNDVIQAGSGAVQFVGENSNSEVEGNIFAGTANGPDIGLSYAEIHHEQGSKKYPALNIFSSDFDIATEGSVPFVYWTPKEPAPPNTVPQNPGNYTKYESASATNEYCGVVTPLVSEDTLTVWINKYCNWYYELFTTDVRDASWYEKYKKFKKLERKLHRHYYYYSWYWGDKKDWTKIEEILKKLCTYQWKKRLYGHYVFTHQLSKANAVLLEMESALSRNDGQPFLIRDDERDNVRAFIDIENIYLTYLFSGRQYALTPEEKEFLTVEASDTLPELAYAKGLLYELTGEIVQNQWPYISGNGIQYRSDNRDKLDSWSVYPNPVSGKLKVRYNDMEEFEGTIALYSILGNKVYEESIDMEKGEGIEINTGSYDNGVYIVYVTGKDGKEMKIHKIVINHK